MKAMMEITKGNPGVVLVAETDEERNRLLAMWCGHTRAVAFLRADDNYLELVIAPTLKGE